MTKIELKPIPPSVNHLYGIACKGGHAIKYKKQDAKDLMEDYGWQIKQQTRRNIYTEPLSLDITIYFGDRRRHDVDNVQKFLLDSMTGIVYEDDSQIWDLTIRKRIDIENPRVEISVKTLK